MKILLAVDGSEASLAAVEEVARTPWPEGSVVRIVSVAEVPFSDQQWAAPMQSGCYEEWERSGFLMYTTQAMARFVEIAGERIKVTAKTLMGDPKIAILDEAEHWGADLTIDGSEFSDVVVEEIADRPGRGEHGSRYFGNSGALHAEPLDMVIVVAYGTFEEVFDKEAQENFLTELDSCLPHMTPVESRLVRGSKGTIVFRIKVEEAPGMAEEW